MMNFILSLLGLFGLFFSYIWIRAALFPKPIDEIPIFAHKNKTANEIKDFLLALLNGCAFGSNLRIVHNANTICKIVLYKYDKKFNGLLIHFPIDQWPDGKSSIIRQLICNHKYQNLEKSPENYLSADFPLFDENRTLKAIDLLNETISALGINNDEPLEMQFQARLKPTQIFRIFSPQKLK